MPLSGSRAGAGNLTLQRRYGDPDQVKVADRSRAGRLAPHGLPANSLRSTAAAIAL